MQIPLSQGSRLHRGTGIAHMAPKSEPWSFSPTTLRIEKRLVEREGRGVLAAWVLGCLGRATEPCRASRSTQHQSSPSLILALLIGLRFLRKIAQSQWSLKKAICPCPPWSPLSPGNRRNRKVSKCSKAVVNLRTPWGTDRLGRPGRKS